MTMTTTESGPAVRLDPRLPCDIDAILGEGDSRRRVRIVDLSRSGALVEASPLPRAGQAVLLQFALPTQVEPLVLTGVVMRRLAHECGVRFTELLPTSRGALEKYLFVRTCHFGWLSAQRLFSSGQQLAATWGVMAMSSLILLFGGRQLLASVLVDNGVVAAWTDFALIAVAMLPATLSTTLAYGLRLAPAEVRDALLFGGDPAGALKKSREAIRRTFGLARQEIDSLLDVHVADWALPTERGMAFVRLGVVFVLIYVLFCTLALR